MEGGKCVKERKERAAGFWGISYVGRTGETEGRLVVVDISRISQRAGILEAPQGLRC